MKAHDIVNCGKLSPDSMKQDPQSSIPVMQEFQISLAGIMKLLRNLKPGKAAGPDKIRPVVLKELREEISPIIKGIFDRSIENGKLSTDWCHAFVTIVLRKVTNLKL